jgi:hypothetical protein
VTVFADVQSQSTTAAPNDHGLDGRGLAEHREAVGGHGVSTGSGGPAQGLASGLQLGHQRLVASAQGGELVLQVEEPAYALDADAGGGVLSDRAQELDVAVGVAPSSTHGPTRCDQPEPLVAPQGLRVQPGQLGRDADDIDRRVWLRRLEGAAHDGEPSKRLARSGLPAVAAR